LCATLLIQVGHDVGLCAAAVVVFGLFVVLGEEFECGESANLVFLADLRVLLVISVNVGDHALESNKYEVVFKSDGGTAITLPSDLNVLATSKRLI
jgi:hypothetical protein